MNRRFLAMVMRAFVVASVGLLGLWSVPQGGQLTFAGLVLMLVTVCGCFVKLDGVAWYSLGAVLVIASLVLGVVDGPFDVATTGYCNSVFEPHLTQVEDAPPGTYERCEQTRQERIPLVVGLALLGLAALVLSLRPRPPAVAMQAARTSE